MACREGWRPGLHTWESCVRHTKRGAPSPPGQASQHGSGAVPQGADRQTPYGKDTSWSGGSRARLHSCNVTENLTEGMTPAEVKGEQCFTPPDTPAKLSHHKASSPGGHGADPGQVGGTLSSGIQWAWPSRLVLGVPDGEEGVQSCSPLST